jgi:thioester reductase-like protein
MAAVKAAGGGSEGLILLTGATGYVGGRLLAALEQSERSVRCLALERSDYRRFRRSGAGEMREFFAEVEVIVASPGFAWYLCRT